MLAGKVGFEPTKMPMSKTGVFSHLHHFPKVLMLLISFDGERSSLDLPIQPKLVFLYFPLMDYQSILPTNLYKVAFVKSSSSALYYVSGHVFLFPDLLRVDLSQSSFRNFNCVNISINCLLFALRGMGFEPIFLVSSVIVFSSYECIS